MSIRTRTSDFYDFRFLCFSAYTVLTSEMFTAPRFNARLRGFVFRNSNQFRTAHDTRRRTHSDSRPPFAWERIELLPRPFIAPPKSTAVSVSATPSAPRMRGRRARDIRGLKVFASRKVCCFVTVPAALAVRTDARRFPFGRRLRRSKPFGRISRERIFTAI